MSNYYNRLGLDLRAEYLAERSYDGESSIRKTRAPKGYKVVLPMFRGITGYVPTGVIVEIWYDGSNCSREYYAQIKPLNGGTLLYTDDFHYM